MKKKSKYLSKEQSRKLKLKLKKKEIVRRFKRRQLLKKTLQAHLFIIAVRAMNIRSSWNKIKEQIEISNKTTK